MMSHIVLSRSTVRTGMQYMHDTCLTHARYWQDGAAHTFSNKLIALASSLLLSSLGYKGVSARPGWVAKQSIPLPCTVRLLCLGKLVIVISVTNACCHKDST